jgi:hypothetical protein
VTRGILDPWLKDAIAGTVGISILSKLSGESLESTVESAVPLLSIAIAFTRSVGIFADYYEDDVGPALRRALQLAIAGIGTALVYISPLPLQLVATSITGASLMYESFITELVGNWFYMFERMPPEKRRSIRQQAYQKLQQKLIYPVRSAYDQIHAAICNETLAEPKTHEKVNNAIYNSYQVRLVWACATAGILFQMTLSQPLARTASTIYTWWNDRYRKTKAI